MCRQGSNHDTRSIIEILRHRTAETPERIAYRFISDKDHGANVLQYAELDSRAMAIGGWLTARGLTGCPIALIFAPGLDYVIAFFGVLYAGGTAVPLNPPGQRNANSRLEAVLGDVKCSVALTSTSLLSRIVRVAEQIPCLSTVEFVTVESIPDSAASEWRDPRATPDAVALLQYTSGSTSAPKGVKLRNRNLLHNISMMTRVSGLDHSSVGVSWLPQYHDMGLVAGILMPAYAGFPVTLLSPASFLIQPVCWLEAISMYGATVSGGPNFAYEHCVRNIRQEDLTNIDLNTWRVAYSGAEPIRAQTIDRFVAMFAPCGFRRQTFFPCYGLAEATLMVSGGPVDAQPVSRWIVKAALNDGRVIEAQPDAPESVRVQASGALIADHDVVIVDPEAKTPCEDNRVGEIWVAGGSVGCGYWNRTDESEQMFEAHLADSKRGPFLRSGDLGFVHDGMLFVVGRSKDLVIIRGTNYHPQDIEQTVEECHPSLRPGCGAAFSVEIAGEERLVIVYEVDRKATSLLHNTIVDSIVENVAERHGLRVFAIVLIKQGTIFKTTSGKIQRQRNRSAFLANDLAVIGEWRPPPSEFGPSSFKALDDIESFCRPGQEAQIETVLVNELARLLGTDPALIDPEQSIYRLGLDSLIAAQLRNHLVSNLDIELDISDLMRRSTIKELISHVRDRMTKGRTRATAETLLQITEQIAQLSDAEVAELLAAEQRSARQKE
jgi:acyl-CoA synthetase (AMP-forming)/AMP-acid ligase II/acyl carrier protein